MADMCKVGDKVWRLSKNGIMETTCIEVAHYPHAVYKFANCYDSCFDRAFGRTVFLSLEDANKAIQVKEKIAKKREMLKQYEAELNEKLGLENHKIIK